MSAATDRRDIGDDDFRDKIRQFAQEARARGKSEPVTRTPLRLLSVDDALNAPPREYILDDLLAERELSVWWGRPKCGKSFLMLRLAYGLALGEGMWGKKVRKPVLVIYVAAEGEGGVKGRIRALADAMGKAPHFRFIAQRVDLLAPNADVGPLITMIQDLLKTLHERRERGTSRGDCRGHLPPLMSRRRRELVQGRRALPLQHGPPP